jgi:hypothetical protein
MSPSMFTCANEPKQAELDVAMGWNGQAEHLLTRHWDEWIKEEDFQWLASVGEYVHTITDIRCQYRSSSHWIVSTCLCLADV